MTKKINDDEVKLRWIWDKPPLGLSKAPSVDVDPRTGRPSRDYSHLFESSKVQDSKLLVMQSALTLPAESRQWLYDAWISRGELTVIAGPVGAGKSTLLCALAAGVTIGSGFEVGPGLTSNGRGYVVYVNTEDNFQTALTPCLQVLGADLNYVRVIETRAQQGVGDGFSFDNELHLERLAYRIQHEFESNLALLIVEPIASAVAGALGNDSLARRSFEGLTAFARRFNCAVVAAAHTGRNIHGKPPLDRVAGPPALRQVPRSTIVLNKIANGPTKTGGTHVAVHARNVGRVEGGLEYRIAVVEVEGPNGPIK